MGFALLNFKIRAQKSVAGISSRMLELFILHLSTRLMATCLKNGYIPMDSCSRAKHNPTRIRKVALREGRASSKACSADLGT